MNDPWSIQSSSNTTTQLSEHPLFGNGLGSGFLADVTNAVNNIDNRGIANGKRQEDPRKVKAATFFDTTVKSPVAPDESPVRSMPFDLASAILDDDGATPKQQKEGFIVSAAPAPQPQPQQSQESHLVLEVGKLNLNANPSTSFESSIATPLFPSNTASAVSSPTVQPPSLNSTERNSRSPTSSESEDSAEREMKRQGPGFDNQGRLINPNPQLQQTLAVVEFKMDRRLRFRCPFHMTVQPGQFVIVQLETGGEDCGVVEGVYENPSAMKRACVRGVPHHEFGTIVRVANDADCVKINETLPDKEEEALAKAHQLVHFLHLPFTVVDAEYQFDFKMVKVFYTLAPQSYTSVMPNVSRLQRELTFLLKTKVVIEQLKPKKSQRNGDGHNDQ